MRASTMPYYQADHPAAKKPARMAMSQRVQFESGCITKKKGRAMFGSRRREIGTAGF
jgi:hypothetical protein